MLDDRKRYIVHKREKEAFPRVSISVHFEIETRCSCIFYGLSVE